MTYTALDKNQSLTRLLHLNPALNEEDEIKCELKVVLLDDKPHYEALSYAWGDVTDTIPVELDGCSKAITLNLYSALKNLRLQDQNRILWVDALCINQEDFGERMHQVSLMGSIYGQASQVVVWLGESWDGSDIAMEFLRRMGGDDQLHLTQYISLSTELNGLKINFEELCGHLIHLFDLPWWTRVWTIQECVLAQELEFRCSKSRLSRDLMLSKLEYTTDSRSFGVFSLLRAMLLFRDQDAMDPRDRIHGMLALGTGEYANLVDADYTIQPEKACEAVALNSVERTGTLEFLSHLVEQKSSNLPSFVPNWTGIFLSSRAHINRLSFLQHFNASLNMIAQLDVISEGIISVHGLKFDIIKDVSSPVDDTDFSWYGLHKEMNGNDGIWSKFDKTGNPYCQTWNSRKLAFFKTLCHDMELIQENCGEYVQRQDESEALSKCSKWEAWLVTSPKLRYQLLGNQMRCTWDTIHASIFRRRFIQTKKGYIGLAPVKCQKGDLLVVLAGGNVPYILRPVPTTLQVSKIPPTTAKGLEAMSHREKLISQTWYTVIGDSYVHGIMDGEAFTLLDEKDRQLRDFILI